MSLIPKHLLFRLLIVVQELKSFGAFARVCRRSCRNIGRTLKPLFFVQHQSGRTLPMRNLGRQEVKIRFWEKELTVKSNMWTLIQNLLEVHIVSMLDEQCLILSTIEIGFSSLLMKIWGKCDKKCDDNREKLTLGDIGVSFLLPEKLLFWTLGSSFATLLWHWRDNYASS